MKKIKGFKGFMVFVLAAVCALTVVFAGCKTPQEPDKITLSSIQVETRSAKLLYELNEDFTTEGLVVKVVKKNETQNKLLDPEVLALDDEALTIDSSAFRKGVVGEYKINVSYQEGFIIRSSSYLVNVKRSAGLYVEKTTVDYDFNVAGTEISVNDLTVQMAGVTGLRGDPLTASQYTVTAFKNGTEEVPVSNGKFTATTAGAYQVWVKVTNYSIPGDDVGAAPADYENFVLINVIDALQSISFNSGAAGTLTTQSQSVIDRMTATWNFTVTFKSGATQQVTAMSDGVKIDINTNEVKADAKANVSYDYEDCKGVKTTAATQVDFTITTPTVAPVKNSFSFNGLSKTIRENSNLNKGVALTNADLGTNTFMNILPGAVCNARNNDGNILEIKGEAIEVEFQGVGTISITARSTGNSNTSSIAVMDEDGNYVAASFTSSAFKKDDFENTYMVTGAFDKLIFTILKPGKYIICTVGTVMVNGTPTDTNRNTRINAISLVDERGEV